MNWLDFNKDIIVGRKNQDRLNEQILYLKKIEAYIVGCRGVDS